jgi:hypothetical protein
VRAMVSRIVVWQIIAPRMFAQRAFVWRTFVRRNIPPGIVSSILLTLLLALAACSKPPDAPSSATPEPRKTTGLESIPAPDPSKFPKFQDMSDWKNPYFVIRDDGIGFVDLANHEVHILTPEQIPAELVSLPSSAWPYGRVVLVTEAQPKIPTDEAKAEVRKNRGLLVGTLRELDVQIREFP